MDYIFLKELSCFMIVGVKILPVEIPFALYF